MLTLASSKDYPKISSFRMRLHATSPEEADEIISLSEDGRVIPVDKKCMPYLEAHSEISEDERPSLKKIRAGESFRLAVYNFSANSKVPLVGFSVERVRDSADIYVEGSQKIIDPSKSGMTKPAIAVIPLLYIFNAQIEVEAQRSADLIAKVTGNNVVSLPLERDRRMMEHALTATYNVMQALYGNEEQEKIEEPKTGIDCLSYNLGKTLDASSSFYDALMNKARDLFEPSIRRLANNVALNHANVNSIS